MHTPTPPPKKKTERETGRHTNRPTKGQTFSPLADQLIETEIQTR